ncbi:hypothetical protein H2248_002934 [Termitomyces sp. 'cryptogamus']|nr:hypothetical protein H2248_002934 [Termitomyces sp. 'cryptogamus']
MAEQKGVVGEEGEGTLVFLELVRAAGSVESELGKGADLVKKSFFIEEQGRVEMFWQDHNSFVQGVLFSFKGLPGVHIGSLDEGNGFCSKMHRAAADDEVILEEGFGPPSLAAAELLCYSDVLQVVVVRVDLDLVLCTLEICVPLLESLNMEFLVVDIIVEFWGNH